MALRFGTDGVRDVANTALTPEFALSLGRAAARVLGVAEFVVGRDTRRSGPLLAQAFHAGLASEGASVVDLGVVPTPCVSYVADQRAAAGAVVSASHNPFADNGIKIFGAGGRKLADDVESAIEAELAALAPPSRHGADVGDIALDDGSGVECYLDHLRSALAGRRLDGLQVVIDGANGAAAALAPGLFRSVGADVVAVCCSPSGININDGCGATHPMVVGREVVAAGARLGLALDGDADRLMAADHSGETVDGDQIMAILARELHDAGRLKHDTVVVTVMTNLGFRLGMEASGIRVIETQVGDRYVLEALDSGGYSLGGEQSGHVIMRDLASTGDGMLTGLLLSDVVCRTGTPLRALADAAMQRLPQVLVNVRLDRNDPTLIERLGPDIADTQSALGSNGRVLVRPSGTEPLLRVMVEAPTADQARSAADRLAIRARELAS